ncbi:hypothetical protein KQX54_005475 [Cotesia glomerata]|uniref:Uncharacterized protein n=1 Tax=Cotesia glomerata TaxID=32391 RepID=A0AAV7HRB2_COTGL|nr:hypothetical protein KQX54_005475 [Cotesia glomerata]
MESTSTEHCFHHKIIVRELQNEDRTNYQFVETFRLILQKLCDCLFQNSSSNNDGLTKQQIELIQQIMQQTQQQQPSNSQQPLSSSPASSSVTQTSKSVKPAKVVTAANNSATGVNSAGGNASASSSPKPKVWSQAQLCINDKHLMEDGKFGIKRRCNATTRTTMGEHHSRSTLECLRVLERRKTHQVG